MQVQRTFVAENISFGNKILRLPKRMRPRMTFSFQLEMLIARLPSLKKILLIKKSLTYQVVKVT